MHRLQGLELPRRRTPATRLTIAIVIAVVATAFAARGGSQLERTTWTEVAIMLAGAQPVRAGAGPAACRPRTPARLRGAVSLAGFALLAVFTALSITWSLMPDDSWIEANRTLAYLAAFAGALALGRLAPARWSAVLYGIALGAVALCALVAADEGLPGWLAPDDDVRPPAPAVRLLEQRRAHGRARHPAAAVARRAPLRPRRRSTRSPGPASASRVMCLMLAYSRGALLALAIGLALWFAVVPLRLRAADRARRRAC